MPTTAAACAAVAGALLALLVTAVVVRGGEPFGIDTALHDWALEHRTPAWNDVFTALTHTGSGIPPLLLAAVAGALAVRSRRWQAWLPGAVAGAIALLTGQAIRYGLVSAVGRDRPPIGGMVLHATGPALPSGHASTSAMAAIGLAAALLPYCRGPASRALAVGLPALWAVLIGFTRVYLGVHWATDALAGWLFALTLTCLTLPWLGTVLRRLAMRAETSLPPARAATPPPPARRPPPG